MKRIYLTAFLTRIYDHKEIIHNVPNQARYR